MANDPIDSLYLSGIEIIAKVIGYEAAYRTLFKEFQNRSDVVKSQMFSLNGVLMNDVATIVKRHEDASVRFSQNGSLLEVHITGVTTQQEATEIRQQIDDAIKSRNQLPGIPEVEDSFTSTITAVEVEDDEKGLA